MNIREHLTDWWPFYAIPVILVGVAVGVGHCVEQYSAKCRALGGIPHVTSHNGSSCFKSNGERIDVGAKR